MKIMKILPAYLFHEVEIKNIEKNFQIFKTSVKMKSGIFISSYSNCKILITIDAFILSNNNNVIQKFFEQMIKKF